MTSQIARFIRLFVFALVPGLVAIATGQTALTTTAIVAVAVGALEVAWRNYNPTTTVTTTAPANHAQTGNSDTTTPAPTSSAPNVTDSSTPPAA